MSLKKLVSLVIISICLCQTALTQEKSRFGQLEKTGDSVFIAESGKRYTLDSNTITVKLKAGVDKIEKDVKILRSNRLGYTDISVPEGVDVVNFVAMLEKTDKFEKIRLSNYFLVKLKSASDTVLLQREAI